MNPLKVWFYAYYLTSVDNKWRDDDFKANRLVKCAKGEAFPHWVEFSVTSKEGKVLKRFDNSNRDELLSTLCNTVAGKLRSEIKGGFTIVPVPNKGALLGDTTVFRTEEMANRVASSSDGRAKVKPVLRWKQQLAQARKGGSRSSIFLTNQLVLGGQISGPTIIFDDVITSGSHMLACSSKLREAGVEPIFGIAVGRTTDTQQPQMTGWHREQLGDERALFDFDF